MTQANMTALLQVLLAYLLGSIPFAYLAGKLQGKDLRQHGSGNLGATNVFRVLGPGPGVAVLLLDIAKGAAAVALLPKLGHASRFAALFSDSAVDQAWWPCVLGLAAVLGHTYTVFLGFKGGKGVATSAGVFLGLAPYATLGVIAVFLLAFGLSRMVSLGSLLAAAALPGLVAAFNEWRPVAVSRSLQDLGRDGWSLGARPVFWLALTLALLVWLKHIPNIKRIAAGTESRFKR